MSSMSNSLGTRIKELRQISGLSQEELGNRVGVRRAAINKYEKGSVTNIPITTIEKLANIFEVSPSYLMGWVDDGVPNDLAVEVRVLGGVKRFFGDEAVQVLEVIRNVDKTGRRRIVQYCEDMLQVYGRDINE